MRRTHEIAIAATWGVVNHVLFAAAIAMLVNGLYHGLTGTFALWTPSGILLHQATGGWLWLFRAAFCASWMVLLKAMRDAGLGVQTGYIGWLSVVRGEKPAFGDFPTHGLFRHCRQPVYLGFALTLWTAPVHTLDGLLLALPWSMYCVAAPLHKELRYLSAYGERFSKYRSLVPYFLPRIRS